MPQPLEDPTAACSSREGEAPVNRIPRFSRSAQVSRISATTTASPRRRGHRSCTRWYCTGKTHAADLDRLAFLAPSVTNSERLDAEKALCFLNDGFRGQLIDHAPLAAVLMPHVGMGTTRLRPASPLEALLALGPSTTSQLPYAGREVLETLSAVVRQVPCYHLDIGADAAGVAPMIASLLKMSTERAESAYLARGHA